MKKQVPTDPAGWKDRAAEYGWMRDPAKRRDLAMFEEGLATIPVGKLWGVRVGYMTLEAWWTEAMTFTGTGANGLVNSRSIDRLISTALHHVPPAASYTVDRGAEIDEKPWCPAHAFACRPSKERGCGYNCLDRPGCDCTACEFSYNTYGVELEKKLGLVHISRGAHLRDYLEQHPDVAERGSKKRKALVAKPKVVKAKKPKRIDHKLEGQVGFFAQKQ